MTGPLGPIGPPPPGLLELWPHWAYLMVIAALLLVIRVRDG